jgi:photosystem II stability/assembly factor-like uncharacterized protein
MGRAVIAGVRRVCGRFVLAPAILLAVAGTIAGAEWSEIGSGLPRTNPALKSLVIDSATPSTVYAIDWDGRLFKSTDAGTTFNVRGTISGVRFVVVDPTLSSTVYAVTQRGVFKSADGGESWTAADSGLEGIAYYSITLAIDPLTPATLYAATERGVFKSTDAARSWNKLDTLPPEPGLAPFTDTSYSFAGITIDPVAPSTLYFSFEAGNNDRGILKSTDGGQSWNRLNTGPGVNIFPLVVDPVTSSTLYAVSTKNDGAVYKSTDGGQTWTMHPLATSGGSALFLALDPISPSTVYAVTAYGPGRGILKSMDAGDTWSVLDTGPFPFSDPGGTTFLLAIAPTNPATVYTGYFYRLLPSGHLAKSTDGGATWNALDAGLTYVDVRALTIDPVVPSRIYAGMSGAPDAVPVFKSAEAGATWTSIAQLDLGGQWSCWITSLLVDPTNPNVIYAAANGEASYSAVFKTTDAGAKWAGTYFFAGMRVESTTVMVLDAADSKTIYLGDYVDPIGDGGAMLFKSVDSAATWTDSYYWDIGPMNALVIDPRNRATLYAGTRGGVFGSADAGASWNNLGLSTGVTSLALEAGDSNTIYAAAGNFSVGFLGLFKSTDGGASWAPINNGLTSVLVSRSTVTAIALAPGNPGTVYVATSGRGVYRSQDGGANWESMNQGLTNLDVRLLTVAPNALYAVTTSGIFKVID